MAWLTDWKYRKPITLSRASGAVTNYQMKLLVGESAGATGEDVDCGGKCLSTFNDLRFTAADGFTLLDYWVESLSGTTPNQLATIWIEFDSIGTSATTFYMYYGKSDAAAVSNGANTFIVFDDFERGSNGDSIGGAWNEYQPHVHISTEQDIGNVTGFTGTRSAKFIGATTPPQATINLTAGDNQAIYFRVYKETAAAFNIVSHGNGTNNFLVYHGADENIGFYDGNWNALAAGPVNQWYKIEIKNINFTAGTYDIYINDTLFRSAATMRKSTARTDEVLLSGPYAADSDAWVDNVIVRNWRSTEPAWGSWGSEEEYRAFKSMLILTGSGWREARGI